MKAITRVLCLAVLAPLVNACLASQPSPGFLSEADIAKGCMNPEMESRFFMAFNARVLDMKADGVLVLVRSDDGKRALIKLAGITLGPHAFGNSTVNNVLDAKTVEVLVDPKMRDQENLKGMLHVAGKDFGEWLLLNGLAEFNAGDIGQLSSYTACRYRNIASRKPA